MHRVWAALLMLPLFACSAPVADEAAEAVDELAYDGQSYKWIYEGPLPALQQPSITISLMSHTARVSGYLPGNYSGTLPFYADAVVESGRLHVAVVYPVATGAATNAPGEYASVTGVPYVPTSDHAAWGGFPFLSYNLPRGIALHGPITHDDAQWKLIRGPVSHGCNRMQGEHVVEVAQLLGIDMAVPHASSDRQLLKAPVSVITTFDKWQGKLVDVDYPAQKSVKRPPAAQSHLFRTWSSDDFPVFVCKYDKRLPLGPSHCDRALKNRRDVTTGETL